MIASIHICIFHYYFLLHWRQQLQTPNMEDQATLRFIKKMIPIGNLQKLSLLSGAFLLRGLNQAVSSPSILHLPNTTSVLPATCTNLSQKINSLTIQRNKNIEYEWQDDSNLCYTNECTWYYYISMCDQRGMTMSEDQWSISYMPLLERWIRSDIYAPEIRYQRNIQCQEIEE